MFHVRVGAQDVRVPVGDGSRRLGEVAEEVRAQCGGQGTGKHVRLFFRGRELSHERTVREAGVVEDVTVVGMLVDAPARPGGTSAPPPTPTREATPLRGFDRFRAVGFDDDGVTALRATYADGVVAAAQALGPSPGEGGMDRVRRAEDAFMMSQPRSSEFWLNMRPSLQAAVARLAGAPDAAVYARLEPIVPLLVPSGVDLGQDQPLGAAAGGGGDVEQGDGGLLPPPPPVEDHVPPGSQTARNILEFCIGFIIGWMFGFLAFLCLINQPRLTPLRNGILAGLLASLFGRIFLADSSSSSSSAAGGPSGHRRPV
jgi:hypothetical protein